MVNPRAGHTIVSDGDDSIELWPEPFGARLDTETRYGVTTTYLTIEQLRHLADAATHLADLREGKMNELTTLINGGNID
jgi:hypothetical protein